MNEIRDTSEITGEINMMDNTMDQVNTTCRQDEANGVFEGLAITFGLAIFVTNLVVVIAIKKGGKKLRKARFYCIANLAVADMLAGVLLLWIFGLQRILITARPPYVELVLKCIWTSTIWTSLMSQVVIALDRYTHVRMGTGGRSRFFRCNTWGNTQRRKMVLIGIALTWIIPAIIYVVPVLTIWNCASGCRCYTRDNNTDVVYMTCDPSDYCSEVNPGFSKSSMLMLGLVLLTLPMLSFILYGRIYSFVKKSSNRTSRSSQRTKHVRHIVTDPYLETLTRRDTEDASNNYSRDESYDGRSTPFLTPDQSDSAINQAARVDAKNRFINGKIWRGCNGKAHEKSRDRLPASVERYKSNGVSNGTKRKTSQRLQQRNRDRDMRLLHTMIMILVLFVITTVPLGIVLTLSYTETDKRYLGATKYMLMFSLLNSVVNPWVYFWRFSEMRKALTRLVCSSRKELSRKQPQRKIDISCCVPRQGKSMIFVQQNSKRHNSSNSSNSF